MKYPKNQRFKNKNDSFCLVELFLILRNVNVLTLENFNTNHN